MPYDPSVNYQPTHAEVVAAERRSGHFTRLDAYQEALEFLEQAVESLDQARSCLKDAKCEDIMAHAGPYRVDVQAAGGLVSEILKAARAAECEDCDKPLAECGCAWLREFVR